ncbi:MAG TPA: hypothetical protein VGG74_20265 [Kofleriaceae bacterium]|jgi:hypothetical protein
MRAVITSLLLAGFVIGCAKKNPPPPFDVGPQLGVAACDEFLVKFARCVNAATQGSPMRDGMLDDAKKEIAIFRDGWSKPAADPARRDELADQCKAAAAKRGGNLDEMACPGVW